MTTKQPQLRLLFLDELSGDAGLTPLAFAQKQVAICVEVVESVAEMLARLTPDDQPYDALLIDLKRPGNGGFDLLADLHRRNLPLPIIALTPPGNHDVAVGALKAGADDYLPLCGEFAACLTPTLATAVDRFRSRRLLATTPLRVLYAEDSEADAELVRRYLARHAAHISLDVVDNGAAALTLLQGRGGADPKYDVVLLDYRLPGADGLEVSRTLRLERGLDTPLVLVTGAGDKALLEALPRLGINDYLEKSPGYLDKLPALLEGAYERVRRQRQRASEHAVSERLQHVLAASPAIVYTLRQEAGSLVPTWVSENITRLFGFTPADCLQPDWWASHLHPDDRESVLGRLPRLFAEGSLVQEYRFFDQSGTPRWVRDQLRVLPGSGERQELEVVGAWHDITAERQTEERLRLYGVALESAREAVFITDLTPRIVAVNPAFTRLTGYSESEALGQNPRLLRSGRHDADFYRTMWQSVLVAGFWDGELWNRRKDGEIFPQHCTIHAVCNDSGVATHYVAVASDLSQLKHSEEKLRRLAHFDLLTDLPNRVLLELRLDHALKRAVRHGLGVAVLFIDLDGFKRVNDSLGHAAGDSLLQAVAQRLRARLRSEDTLARMTGDRFVVVMEGVADFHDAERMARELQSLLASPFVLAGEREVFITASVGVSICPEDGNAAQILLERANTAEHQAKALGGNQLCFYTSELNNQALNALETEAALRRGLERGEFVLYYQPKVALVSGHIVGAEALLRWQRPEHGLVPPQDFISVAERSNLIVSLGAWVIDEACRQLHAWNDAGLIGVSVAVNVSARQFRSGDLESVVDSALRRYAIDPPLLMLELTETMLMEHPEESVARLKALKALGVQLSLDDFGTGYSSLGYLSRFPVDQLKIDRSFVSDIVSNPSSAIIATSVIALAHRMGIDVVAEGVETEPQLGYLRKNRCDKMQGFLFSRPVPSDEFLEQLNQEKSLPRAVAQDAARSLLVVDDEPNILSALRRVLRGEGYRVLTAGSAREGMEILASQPVDVILSDQRMPEMSGTEFLARVKVLHPETVRIVLSGYTELESIIQAVNTGALYKFLTKPWDDQALRGHIREAFLYHDAVRLGLHRHNGETEAPAGGAGT